MASNIGQSRPLCLSARSKRTSATPSFPTETRTRSLEAGVTPATLVLLLAALPLLLALALVLGHAELGLGVQELPIGGADPLALRIEDRVGLESTVAGWATTVEPAVDVHDVVVPVAGPGVGQADRGLEVGEPDLTSVRWVGEI